MRKGDGRAPGVPGQLALVGGLLDQLDLRHELVVRRVVLPLLHRRGGDSPGPRGEGATEGEGAIKIAGEFVVMANSWVPLETNDET